MNEYALKLDSIWPLPQSSLIFLDFLRCGSFPLKWKRLRLRKKKEVTSRKKFLKRHHTDEQRQIDPITLSTEMPLW